MGRPLHFVVTRFNVPHRDGLHSDPAWLAARLKLFSTFTAPSLAGQTCKDFVWYVALAINCSVLAEVHQIVEDLKKIGIRGWYSTRWKKFTYADLPLAVEVELMKNAGDYDRLLITRLDADDAVSKDFVESIQANASVPGSLLSFTSGIEYHVDGGWPIATRMSSNWFSTTVDDIGRFNDLRSPFFVGNHELLHQHFDTVTDIDGPPRWVKVIHDTNCITKSNHNQMVPPMDGWQQRFAGVDKWLKT